MDRRAQEGILFVTRARVAPLSRPQLIGVGVLVGHNVIVHRVLPPPADAALNVFSAVALVRFALNDGFTREDLGLGRADLRRGTQAGLAAGVVCMGIVGLAAAVPFTRRFLVDDRFHGLGRRRTAYHVALRIPVSTALAEELLFRSVLHALFAREYSLPGTLAWTSGLFGAWHILPTLKSVEGNPAAGTSPRRMAVLVTGLATAGAGLMFSLLRLRAKSIVAPVIAHAALNGAAFLAGRNVSASAGLTRSL
jgi:membrane protease YdiL (CAAX protease family)